MMPMKGNYYKPYRRRLNSAIDLEQAIVKLLESMGGDPQKAKFVHLWEEWETILGEDLAALAIPLGTDKKHLLVGVEDALAMQEAQCQKDEILQKVNAWLGEEYFEDARLSLMLGRDARQAKNNDVQLPENSEKETISPKATGIFLKEMDPDSPVAKAYAIYAAKK